MGKNYFSKVLYTREKVRFSSGISLLLGLMKSLKSSKKEALRKPLFCVSITVTSQAQLATICQTLVTPVCFCCIFIFACQGFCVYEALAHIDMIMCILTAHRPVYNESFHCCND